MLETKSPWPSSCNAPPSVEKRRPCAIRETPFTESEPEIDLDAEIAAASIAGKPEDDVVEGGDVDAIAPLGSSTTSNTAEYLKQDRRIRFGPVDVHFYSMTLGSNPGGTSGPPIELGEFQMSERFSSVESHFETSHPYRHPNEYKLANRMSRILRDEIVARDHNEDEICHEIKAAFDIRLSRLRSSKEDILKAWMEEEEKAQKEQQTRDAELLGGLNRGSGKRRIGKRQKKSVSWLSPAFLGKTVNKESADNPSSESAPTDKTDGQRGMRMIHEKNEKTHVSSLGVVNKRTDRRRIKSKSCPSALFSEKHIEEHDTRQSSQVPVKKQATKNFVLDTVVKVSNESSNVSLKKAVFARFFPREGRR